MNNIYIMNIILFYEYYNMNAKQQRYRMYGQSFFFHSVKMCKDTYYFLSTQLVYKFVINYILYLDRT